MKNLQNWLSKFPEDTNSLEIQLEATSKHLKSYLKVIKTHIPELQRLLKSEKHNYKSLENIELSKPLKQLMEIFEKLEDSDLQTLDDLSEIAKRWQNSNSETSQTEQAAG